MEDRSFRCPLCGWTPTPEMPPVPAEPDHCPNCLSGYHSTRRDGEECGGILKPLTIRVREDDSWDLILRCSLCGGLEAQKVMPEDQPVGLLSLAAKPLADPPFPLDRLDQMTRLAGVRGTTAGYFKEAQDEAEK